VVAERERRPGLDDAAAVAAEYSNEKRLEARIRVWTEFLDGPSVVDVAYEAVAEARPHDVLEVGAGWGDLAVRIRDTVGARVTATDLSSRMTTLLHQRDLPVARVDARRLPFADDEFDVVVANAMLYHMPDPAVAVHEFARVLRPGGRLVATTFGADHLHEVWKLVGDVAMQHSFARENGGTILGSAFEKVKCRLVRGAVTFPNREEVRTYVSSTLTRAHLADRLPNFDGPLVAHSDFAVFVVS
jgi:SAM-dependent methyltransferase